MHSSFIKTYLTGLQAIQEAWPYADIIVNAIPPLDKQRENQNLNIVQVDAYNAALAEMCEENGFKFLNSGRGPERPGYRLGQDRLHAVRRRASVQDWRSPPFLSMSAPTPTSPRTGVPSLSATSPLPTGTPVGLISQDPIAVRGAKVPVEFVATKGGSLQGTTSQLVKKGASCSTVTAVPDKGWKFAYWTASLGSAGSSASLTFTVPSNADAGGVVLTAHFTPDEHEHDYVELTDKRIEATCLNGGSSTYECSICGEIIEKDASALGHAWDGGTVTREPQQGVTGERTYTCTRCGTKKTEEIPALAVPTPTPKPDPTPVPTQKPEPTPHIHSYTQTGYTAPTCEAPGSATYSCSCGDSYTEPINATGHSWNGGEETTPPDYGVSGVRTYTCTVCGATRTEEIPALTPTPEPPPVDPPEGGDGGDGGDGSNSQTESTTETQSVPTDPAPEG